VPERLGVRHVYRRVLGLYRAEFRYLILLAALVFVPLGLAESIEIEIDTDEVSLVEGLLLLAAFLGDLSIILVGTVFYSGAVGGLVVERLRGERVAPLALLRQLPLARLAAIDLLVTFGTGFGLILLLVPGLAFLVWFCLAAPVAEIEHRGVAGAMRRSRELVRGRFWTVAGAVLPVWVVTWVADAALDGLAVAIIGETLIAGWLATTVALTLTSPLFALTVADLTVELARSRDASPEAPADGRRPPAGARRSSRA
jgi:hypothetical protein